MRIAYCVRINLNTHLEIRNPFFKVRYLMAEEIGLLKRVPLFNSLGGPELIEVTRRFHEESYEADEFLFFEGDPADKLWIGKTGQIKILKHSESGQEVILLVITPGQLFGAAGT